jgi:hypothetical protein
MSIRRCSGYAQTGRRNKRHISGARNLRDRLINASLESDEASWSIPRKFSGSLSSNDQVGVLLPGCQQIIHNAPSLPTQSSMGRPVRDN